MRIPPTGPESAHRVILSEKLYYLFIFFLIITAPSTMVKISISSFLIGLEISTFVWTYELDDAANQDGTRSVSLLS